MNNTNNENSNTELGKLLKGGSVKSAFIRFAIPGLIGMLFVGMQTVIDGVIVGNLLGSNALASVSIVLPLYSALAAVILVIGIGSQTLVSIAQGEGDHHKAQNAMTTGFFSTIIFSVVVSIIVSIYAEDIVKFMGSNSVLLSDSKSYLLGLFPFTVSIGCAFYNDYMLRSTGQPKVAMILMSSTVIINILLNLFFVIILELGVYGVGLATSVSFTISAIASFCLLHKKSLQIKLTKGKFQLKQLYQILYNGSSEGINEFSGGVTALLFNLTLMKYIGADGVAAFTIINYVYFVGILIFIGVSDGIIPIISYNYGSKNYDKCKEVYKFSATIIGGIGVFIAIILTLFSPSIIELFFSGDSKHIEEMAVRGASIYAIAFLINGYNILTSSMFTAIADAKRSIIISTLRGLIFTSILMYFIPKTFGIEYVWYTIPIAEFLTLIVSITLLQKLNRKWKKN